MPTQKPTAALLARLLADQKIIRIEHCADPHCAGRFDVYELDSGAIYCDYFESDQPGVELYLSRDALESGAQPEQEWYAADE